MKENMFTLALAFLLAACAHGDLVDTHWVLDPPAHNLRGPMPQDDRPESDCDPVKKPDGTIEYLCVVHTFGNYDKLLNENARLKAELKACQQGKP